MRAYALCPGALADGTIADGIMDRGKCPRPALNRSVHTTVRVSISSALYVTAVAIGKQQSALLRPVSPRLIYEWAWPHIKYSYSYLNTLWLIIDRCDERDYSRRPTPCAQPCSPGMLDSVCLE